jgi:hypothetical protein
MKQNFYRPSGSRGGVYDSDADDTFIPPKQQLTTHDTVSGIDDVLAQNDAMRESMQDEGGEGAPPDNNTPETADEESPEQINERENAGTYKPNDRGSAQEGKELGAGGLLGADDKNDKKNKKSSKPGRRKKMIMGGFGGSLAAFLIFILVSLVTGPGQIVQIGHLLEKFHFSSQEDASDTQVSRIIRYLRDPSKPQNVRIGYIGTKIANRVEAKLTKFGIETSYTKNFGLRDGWVLDPACAECEWKGKTPLEVQKYVKTQYGVDVTPTVDPSTGKTKFFMKASDLGYIKGARFVRGSLKDMGYRGITSAFLTRISALRGGATLHPIKALDNKLLAKVDPYITWAKERAKRILNGSKADLAPGTGCTDKCTPTQQSDAASSQAEAADTAAAADKANAGVLEGDASATSKLAASLSGKFALKGALGGAAIAGIMCTVKALAKDANNIKQAQVILPAVRVGLEAVALSGQVLFGHQAGQADLNLKQLGYYKQQLTNKKDGTNWYMAESIQHELGRSGGVATPATLATAGSGTPFDGILDKFKSVLDPVCSTAGQGITIAISFLGGPVSALVSLAAGLALGPPIMSAIAGWMAGDPLNVIGLAGAAYGSVANFGTFFAANQASMSSAGTALTATQTAELNTMRDTLDRQEIANQSFAYRMFSTDDSQSFISQVALAINPNTFTSLQGATSSLLSGISKFGSLFSNIGQLMPAHAYAGAMPYNYGGVPKFGFSVSDMDSEAAQNPTQDSIRAGAILDSGDGGKYIDRVKTCFGDDIYQTTEDGHQVWDVKNGDGYNQALVMQEVLKNQDCTSQETNWTYIRFFVFNTLSIKSIACYEGVDDVCADIGVVGLGQPTTTSTAGVTVDTANLYKDSTSVACAPQTKDVGVADGYYNGQSVKIKLCALPNLDSTGEESTPKSPYYVNGADGKALVNSRVSGLFYKLAADAKTANVPISATSSFRTYAHQADLYRQNCGGGSCNPPTASAGYSNHQMGLAIDFDVPGRSGTVYNWLNTHASKNYGVINLPSEAWHWYVFGG